MLGPLRVSVDGRSVALGGPQQRAVLARLACSVGELVTTDRLVEAVWGDHPTPGVMTTLQTHIFRLRRALEPSRPRDVAPRLIVTHDAGYRLALPADAVDANRFEGLLATAATRAHDAPEEALAMLDEGLDLWHGSALVDLAGYAFVDAWADRLENLRATARELRVQALLDVGQNGRALTEADMLVTAYPLREGPHAQRMLALYRTGRQTDALAAYLEVRSLLADELGIEPGPALRSLHARMLAQDPTLVSPSRPDPVLVPPSTATAMAAATTPLPTTPSPSTPSTSTASAPGSREPTRSAPATRASSVPPAPDNPDDARRGRRARRGPSWTPPRIRRILVGGAAVAVLSAGALMANSPAETPKTLTANSVGIVDATGHVVGGVAVGTSPSALVLARGSLWVANESDGTVMRVDPETRSVTQRVDVGSSPEAIASTGDDVWVANSGDGTVSRISVSAQRVVQTIAVGTSPAALAAGSGVLWVANSADNTVERIDAHTGRIGPVVGVGDGPDGLLVDEGSLWVANGRDGTVSHLDAATGVELEGPVQVGSGPRGLVRFGDDVWVADELSQSVTRIDVGTGRARPVYVADGPTSLGVLDGAVWVAERYAGSLTRIDPATERTTRVPVGGQPRATLASGGRLWVASGAAADTGHRGGTLTVAAVNLPGSLVENDLPGDYGGIDPAFVYDIPTFQAERLVYEGLVAIRYSSTDPQTVVPALAVRLPRAGDGGRSYTFQLRPGLRYSTGAPVLASDFRRGLARVAAVGPGGLYRHVIGMPECIEHPTRCDLSDGVETDDHAGRVTFRLSTPDPDFLHELAILVYPLPAGFQPGVTGPQPGTGPYAVAAYAEGTAYVLRRNPLFRELSVAASPVGYPDELRWLKVPNIRGVADAVLAGRADLGSLTPIGSREGTNALVADLLVTHPAQVHSQATVSNSVIVLDTSRAPFDHLLARQAVSYAVDRRVLADLDGGPLVAVPTCQLLPPGFPGHTPYCPHTKGPVDGTYHGPDLERARALVRASGTLGDAVTVVDVVGDYYPVYQDYVARVLRSLGYRVAVRRLPNTAENGEYILDPANHVQVQSGGWIPDFPGPASFYDAYVRCRTGYPTGYCNASFDRRADAATALQATDPGEALRQWTALDHDVAQQVPVVFGTSGVSWWVTSSRVGDYQSNPYLGGPLLSQLWVR